MAEVQFAKNFLATLDRRPVKLSSDFVSDPKKYPSQSPYTLPRPSHPFPTRSSPTTSSSKSATISITLTPTKPSHSALTLSALPPALTTVLDLKTAFASHAGLPLAAVKILHAKRPAADLKTLKDLLPAPTPAAAELGVMVLGHHHVVDDGSRGAPTPPVQVPGPFKAPPKVQEVGPGSESATAEKGAVGEKGAGERDERFWGDLKDFLVQRLRDEGEGERLMGVFRQAAGDA